MKKPFTKEEQKIMDLLVVAHSSFIKLERMHPAELTEWIPSFHNLQHIISMRILQRDYPKYFLTKPKEKDIPCGINCKKGCLSCSKGILLPKAYRKVNEQLKKEINEAIWRANIDI